MLQNRIFQSPASPGRSSDRDCLAVISQTKVQRGISPAETAVKCNPKSRIADTGKRFAVIGDQDLGRNLVEITEPQNFFSDLTETPGRTGETVAVAVQKIARIGSGCFNSSFIDNPVVFFFSSIKTLSLSDGVP